MDAAQAAGIQHPATTIITPGGVEYDPALITREKGKGARRGRQVWRGARGKQGGTGNSPEPAKGKAGKGKGQGKNAKGARTKGKSKAAKGGNVRQVFTPGKDAKGAGKDQRKK